MYLILHTFGNPTVNVRFPSFCLTNIGFFVDIMSLSHSYFLVACEATLIVILDHNHVLLVTQIEVLLHQKAMGQAETRRLVSSLVENNYPWFSK